jgi:hypothetical protein
MTEAQIQVLDAVLARMQNWFPDADPEQVKEVIQEGFMAGLEEEYELYRYVSKHFSF